ncbi:MAG TPA: NRDE family protein [Burkholderiaceae bacterium]|nr:NRDE family protein [Burkholderiaceae bacterium]
MCLVALAIDHDKRFPLVVAANRDEFYSRPTNRLAWWTPDRGGPAILGGRDLESGGTWMGLTQQGRFAFLTNVRDPRRHDPDAPSRGAIVPAWLSGREATDRFWMRTALSGHNGFNLVAADFTQGECFWASSTEPNPRRLQRGVYGLSNGGLDAPWPKVETLKARLRTSLATAQSVDALAARLFAALADRELAPDSALPETGVPYEWERSLSAAFVRDREHAYGTRCSTLIITERAGRHPTTHVFERSFSSTGDVALLRRSTLRNWPPRYRTDGAAPVEPQAAVSESVVDVVVPTSEAPVKRTRVRTLLRPGPGRQPRPLELAS